MQNLNDKWSEVLEKLKDKIPQTTYETWVIPLIPSSLDNDKIVLLSPFSFTNSALRISHGDVIAKVLNEVFERPVNFEIIQDKVLADNFEKQQKKEKKEELKHVAADISAKKFDGLTQMYSDCNLNTKYKFENFVVGTYNKFAYGAAYAVAHGEKKFNPLFIYGGSGLGKTHLIQAIGNYILLKGKRKVKYVTTENFVNDLLENIFKNEIEKDTFSKGAEKNKKMTKFRQKYRGVDVLLIDDIQFIEGKDRTQEELFNIFDVLYQSGKQIVFTSDRLPSEIPKIPDRLKTRFEWGLIADIGVPDLETRMAILKQLVENDGKINLSLEVLEFLATIFKNNIRELEGAYNKVSAYCTIYGKEPTLEVVKEAINYKKVSKQINATAIVNKTAEFYGLKGSDLIGSLRTANIAYARKIAVYVIRELQNSSWQAIGEVLGGRKYTTMMYSYDEVKKLMTDNDKVKDEINTLFNIINQM